MSGVTKLVPAKLRSSPRMRSSSSGWPIDSWICRIIWSGISSTSIVPRRAVRRGDELERLVGDAARRAVEAEAREDLVAALLADAAVAVERARLRVAVRVRGHRHAGEQEAVALDDVAAFAGDEAMRRRAHLDRSLPSRRSADRSPPLAIPASAGRTSRAATGDGAASDGDAYSPRGAGPRQRARVEQRELAPWRAPTRRRARTPRARPAGEVSPVAA